jgi:serine/threonine protein kinase/tetratricopeptide (TPR) repeat protein
MIGEIVSEKYKLLEKLGSGGMGEVYEAEQTEPIQRRVALKIIKWGMDTKEVVARFESERQALALMDHPNISKVFDAGATDKGRPFFVMEYVKGVPITEYCDTHRLNNRQRLELFIRVCEGIQHAHQKGIIHRDIKASNVLVTIHDDRPVPKIIDFGVAKATAQRLTEKTIFTEMGQLIGTPEYMSPEQAEMTGLDIDTRTDVYSLGVLLYELLVGVLPFESKDLRSVAFDEIRRKIREEEPPRPSTRLTIPGFDTDHALKSRQTDLTALTKQLKGELDWITMKAIAKDRTMRYASASELAADVMRYLKHEPVLAGPLSATYRLKKYVRRHKVGVAAAALIMLAMIVGITGTTVGLLKAVKAEKIARDEAETAQQVSDFLVDLFRVSDPSEAQGNTITAREVLDKGAGRIEEELEGQPKIQARLMDTIGMVYNNLGLYDQATSLLERALEIRRSVLGNEHLEVSDSLHSLGILIYSKGDFPTAERMFREALFVRRKLLGDEHLDIAGLLNDLAMAVMAQGEFEESEPMYRESLAIRRKNLGNEHADVAQSINNLGMYLYRQGEFQEAEQLFREAVEMNKKLLGEEHPEISTNLNNLALVLRDSGKLDEAEQMFRQVLAMDRKFLGDNHPYVAITLNNMGALLIMKEDLAEAERSFNGAINVLRKTFPEDHWQVANAKGLLGGCFTKQERYEEAEDLLLGNYSIIKSQFGGEHRRTQAVLNKIVELYEVWNKPEKAVEYRSLLQENEVKK